MNFDIMGILREFGIIGLFAVAFLAFSYLLFKSHLKLVDNITKQQSKITASQIELTTTFANHFKHDEKLAEVHIQNLLEINKALEKIYSCVEK